MAMLNNQRVIFMAKRYLHWGLPTAGGGIPRHAAGRRRGRGRLLRGRGHGVGRHGGEHGGGDGPAQAALGSESLSFLW